MGLMDRDYMRERRGFEDRDFDPPANSSEYQWWRILAFAALIYLGFKLAAWWDSQRNPTPPPPVRYVASSPTRTPATQPRVTAPSVAATTPAPAPDLPRTIAIKCVNLDGSTTYVASHEQCAARAQRSEVVAHARENLSPEPNVGSIYLCKAYSGERFWAQAHCNQHSALIERIVSVPSNISWEQKVAMGEQQLQAIRAQTAAVTVTQQPAPVSNKAECSALEQHIANLDAMARQPQSAATQDWIRSERKNARDRQFQIHC